MNDVEPSTALVPTEAESTDLAVRRAPEIVLAEAQKAAAALQDVIARKSRKVVFNGKQYLEADDWQLVGKFYGVAAKVISSHYVEYGPARGFEARAVAIRVSDGQEISAADAMCLNDEPTWSKKPLFQLKSMAQTRACAKALRNVLAWVVVLAGYAPTPAEEMQDVGPTAGRKAPHAHAPVVAQQPLAEACITEPQRKRLFAIYRQTGHLDDDVQQWLMQTYGISHSREISKKDYEAICLRLTSAAPLISDAAEPEYMPPDSEA